MARHSFIRMSKLPNVKGRIDYISSPDRQENLYATYQTADAEFWKTLPLKVSRSSGASAQRENASKQES